MRETREESESDNNLWRCAGPSIFHNARKPVDCKVPRPVDAIGQEQLQTKENVSTSTRLKNEEVVVQMDKLSDEVQEQTNTKAIRKQTTAFCAQERNNRRRKGKEETEWIEKQTQFRTRVMSLEKECDAAWQSFFADAGTSRLDYVSTGGINRLFEEMEAMRMQDTNKINFELEKLKRKVNGVQEKMKEIKNGDTTILSELQEKIGAMEAALAEFHFSHQSLLEKYELEERLLEKELNVFVQKIERWENKTVRGTRGGLSQGPKPLHLTSKLGFDRYQAACSQLRDSNNVEGVNDNQVEDQLTDEYAKKIRRLDDAILRSGGATGGWDAREHASFTALLVKSGLSDEVLLRLKLIGGVETCTSKFLASDEKSNQEIRFKDTNCCEYETQVSRFLRRCMRTIVTQSETSVRSHFDWYIEHLELVDAKMQFIQEWKGNKEKERQENSLETDEKDRKFLGRAIRVDSTRTVFDKKTKTKSREKTDRLLEQWKQERKKKDEESKQKLRMACEEVEAKRKQEHLNAKQNVLLYKLQKGQEEEMLFQAAKVLQEVANDNVVDTSTLKENLIERSRMAIEHAKAKRLKLQQIEKRKQKEQRLPPRPESKIAAERGSNSARVRSIFKATAASKARERNKDELQLKARQRDHQNAHSAHISGEKAISDVKIKSFGHVPIQPRTVPAWRKHI